MSGTKTLEVSPETYGMLKGLAKYAGLSKEEMLSEMMNTFMAIRQGYQRIAGDFSCCAFGGSCYETEIEERKRQAKALKGQKARDGENFQQ
jgi:hypothetical protein